MAHIITQDPAHRLVEIISVLQGRTARAKTQIEASTEHTSPFCVREKRQNPSPHRPRKCVKFFQNQVLSQAPYPLTNQVLRHGQSHLPKNPMFRSPHASPRHREKASRYKKHENNAPFFQVRTARANPRNRTYSKSLRGLAHDDVLQLSLLHHKVDELDLKHLSAPRAGATVPSVQVPPKRTPRSVQTHPRMPVVVDHHSALILYPKQCRTAWSHLMSARRG